MGIYKRLSKRNSRSDSFFNFHQIKNCLSIVLIQFVLIMILHATISAAEPDAVGKAKVDLRAWRTALDMYYVDWIKYPKAGNIEEMASLLKKMGYWEQPIMKDPWGKEYIYEAGNGKCHVFSLGKDGIRSADE